MKKLRSRLSLFSRKEGQPSASRDSGPTAAEAWWRMKTWGSQLDLADELERDQPFSRASAENSPHHRGSHMSLPLPSEHLSSLSF